jgi:hypothetical protein
MCSVCELKTDADYFNWSAVADSMRNSSGFDPNLTGGGFHGQNQFCRLKYWKPVTNCVLDLSHMTKGVMRHCIEMMKGLRAPKESYKRRRRDEDGDVKSVEVPEANQQLLIATVQKLEKFRVDTKQQQLSDKLQGSIRGPPDMISSSRTMWGRTKALRMADWATIAQHTGKYLMSNTCTHTKLWQRLLDVLEFYHRREFTDAELATTRLETLHVMCEYELEMPATELALVCHLLLHCADTAAYWGSMTEYWMYDFVARELQHQFM